MNMIPLAFGLAVMLRRSVLKVAFASLAMLTFIRPAFAGKKVYVGAKTPSDRLVSMDQIDHRAWDTLLKKYVDKDGLVNYAALKSSKEDSAILDGYLRTLSSANIKAQSKRDAQFAYWINAYNAVTLHGILREYPTKSIKKHTSNFGGYNIWHDYQLVIGNKAVSLDQIEHKILRKMNEPRIHFAIVCASIGCPRLLNEAYVADRLEEQLEHNTKDFFARKQNFQHDESNRRFHMSSILSWFAEDFGKNRAAQMKTISKWLPTPEARDAAQKNLVRVKYLKYDWNLNEQNRSK